MRMLICISSIVWLSAFTINQGQLLKSHKISFTIKNAGLTVDGSFSDLQANINFDPKHLDKSVLHASVGVASINTGINMRDRDLQMPKYFDVEKYPRIKMVSKKIKHIEKNNYKAVFDVTIEGVTKEVEIPFTYNEKESGSSFSAQFKVNRRDFGVGGKSLILSDEATVFIEVVTKENRARDGITSRK